MESYIPEFREERSKNSDIVITIDGPSGAGKGTLAEFISEKMEIPCYSAGDFFRQLASEKDLTVEELSAQADKKTDIKVDERTLEKGLNESCVIESRISSWVMGDYSNLRIYLTADLEERARRVKKDAESGERNDEEEKETLEQAKNKIKQRDRDNKERYSDYYGIDVSNLEMYDLIIDNTDLQLEDQEQLVKKALKKRFSERL
ncbi:MAG: cytidylate kinase [Candidatus Nanohaloarchaea archaeon]|jgi:cytidylate kinase